PNPCGEEKEGIEPIKSQGTWVPTPRHSGWRSYCTAGLHFLNPSLVVNHLVQYEGPVNCRLGCYRRRRAYELGKRRDQRNTEIIDVKNETQTTVHSPAANPGAGVARHR